MTTPTKGERATILVVDDNEANRALARETLEDEGYRVVVAAGGAEGLASFASAGPDCVLLDVRMPGMDGFTVCEALRKTPRGADVPILFFTALRDVDTFDRALEVGGDDFLTKPVRPTELIVRVQTALKLRRMSAELREQVDSIKRQRDDMVRLQLQKERLMAFVVHDLKNPVNAMDLHAQILIRDKSLPASAREAAGQIRSQARTLTRMILNLLDLSKGDEGKLAPRRVAVDLAALVADVFAELEVTARSKEVTLVSDAAGVTLRADPDLLHRALANLVENAIRYTAVRSTVSVSAAAAAEGGHEIRVADAGAGIPFAMRERVFSPFVQVEAGQAAASQGNRGLGLSFCKLVAEAHGGQIWVADTAPGTTFCLRVPHVD